MLTIDLHTHTNHSHGKNSVFEMYSQAKKLNLTVLGFSEHSPRPLTYSYPHEYREHLSRTFPDYIKEVIKLKSSNQIDIKTPKVLLGLELDFFPAELDFIKNTVLAEPYDYIIGGIHFLKTWGFDASQDDWQNLSTKKKYLFYIEYFQTIKKMAESKLVNVVAHPDIIKIFSIDAFKEWLKEQEAQEIIYQTFKAIKDNNLAFEVSSAGLRKPCSEFYPCSYLMALAKDLNIPVSPASDAHCCDTLAYAFIEVEKYLKKFNFNSVVYFENKKMIETDI